MSQALFSLPRFTNDGAAREHLEAQRWPNGSVCPHCRGTERNVRLAGESHRAGLWFCGGCRSQFTVTVGTVIECSKVPLHKWALVMHLICSSKKGVSAHQLHRTLGVTYKTAWFMAHRIRGAMGDDIPAGQLGGHSRDGVATNTEEGFFSILKRGLMGTFHHVGERLLPHYMKEFDFRYRTRSALGVNDDHRSDEALKGISGKRLTYRRTNAQA